MRSRFKIQLFIGMLLNLGIFIHGAQSNWPQYLGPNRNGVSPEKGLARSWPVNGPRVLWTRQLGEGFGSASINESRVYILDRVEDSRDVLRCLDLGTGRGIWTFSYEAPGKLSHNGSRSAPTIDEKSIYIVIKKCGCIELSAHRQPPIYFMFKISAKFFNECRLGMVRKFIVFM